MGYTCGNLCAGHLSTYPSVGRCRQPGVCSPHHPSWCWGKCQSGNPSQPSSPWPWHQAGLAAGAGGIHLILCATRTASFAWPYIYTVVQVSHFDSKHYSYSDISSLCIIWHCTLSCNFFLHLQKTLFLFNHISNVPTHNEFECMAHVAFIGILRKGVCSWSQISIFGCNSSLLQLVSVINPLRLPFFSGKLIKWLISICCIYCLHLIYFRMLLIGFKQNFSFLSSDSKHGDESCQTYGTLSPNV